MKKTLNTPRVLSSMVTVALLGLIVGAPAWGQEVRDDLFDSYKIAKDKSTDNVHEKAIYVVFRTSDSPDLAGLFFMERIESATYKDQPFICHDAVWSDSSKSYSCSRFVFHNKKVKKETLTVGTLGGTFCGTLRNKYNKNGKVIILKSDDKNCEKPSQCSCYQVKGLCKTGDEYTECQQDFPPGGGAGSGKDN